MPQRIVIVGAGGFGREVLFYIQDMNRVSCLQAGQASYDVMGFVDDNPHLHHTMVCDVPVLGSTQWLTEHRDVQAVCAIGAPRIRRDVVATLEPFGIEFVTIKHPYVFHSRYVELGPGAVLCAGVVLTTQIRSGKHLLVNMNVSVGHDCVFGDFVTVNLGCNLSGNVTLHSGVELGSNVAVIPGRSIGEGAVVGAGAVVTHDLEPNHVYVGIPAKPIRALPPFRRVEAE